LAAFAITLTGSLPARADEPTREPAPVSSAIPWLAQPSPAATFTAPDSNARSSRALWLVLPALALGGAALYVKLSKRRGAAATVTRKLQVLDTTRVGPKAHVVMVSVGGRQLLIGVTDQSVQRLAWMPAERAAETKPAEVEAPAFEPPAVPVGPFAHLLKQFSQGKVVINDGSDAALKIAADTRDFVERRTVAGAEREPSDAKLAPKPRALPAHEAASDFEGQVSGLRKKRTGKFG
jgi:flagellar biogenesis protein FliO